MLQFYNETYSSKIHQTPFSGRTVQSYRNRFYVDQYVVSVMVEKGKALDSKNILFMSDLFAWALCGNRTVDRTIASTSQLVNPLIGDWNYNITLLTPFQFLFFPEIVDPGTICGYYNGIAVTNVAGHNVQSAIAAMPCKEKEEAAFLVYGASSVIGCELDNPVLTKTSLEAGLFNEIGANRKFNYLKNVRGICMQVFY